MKNDKVRVRKGRWIEVPLGRTVVWKLSSVCSMWTVWSWTTAASFFCPTRMITSAWWVTNSYCLTKNPTMILDSRSGASTCVECTLSWNNPEIYQQALSSNYSRYFFMDLVRWLNPGMSLVDLKNDWVPFVSHIPQADSSSSLLVVVYLTGTNVQFFPI